MRNIQIVRPFPPSSFGLVQGIVFFVQTRDDSLVFDKALSILDQAELELTHHLQRLQVIAADLAAYITCPAGHACIDNVSHRI
jgi:hypothetical protein